MAGFFLFVRSCFVIFVFYSSSLLLLPCFSCVFGSFCRIAHLHTCLPLSFIRLLPVFFKASQTFHQQYKTNNALPPDKLQVFNHSSYSRVTVYIDEMPQNQQEQRR